MAGDFLYRIEIHITTQTIVRTIDSNVHDDCTGFYHVGRNEFRNTYGSELAASTGTLRSPKLARTKLAPPPTDHFNLVAHL